MDIRKIKKLIELINETGVSEIEVKSGEESVRISRLPASVPVQTTFVQPVASSSAATSAFEASLDAVESSSSKAASAAEPEGYALKAPMVGTVYLASTPGAKPLVEVGQHVSVGDTLCLIEAMKMFNKIEADKAGVVSARLIDNEQPVEYDQTLFIIDPDE